MIALGGIKLPSDEEAERGQRKGHQKDDAHRERQLLEGQPDACQRRERQNHDALNPGERGRAHDLAEHQAGARGRRDQHGEQEALPAVLNDRNRREDSGEHHRQHHRAREKEPWAVGADTETDHCPENQRRGYHAEDAALLPPESDQLAPPQCFHRQKSRYHNAAPVSRKNTSSNVGLCSPTDSIAPGNASTTSVMNRWPLAISTRSVPLAVTGSTWKRDSIFSANATGSPDSRITTSPPIFALSCAGLPSDTNRPSCRRTRRSHLSASSRMWLVSSTVTPSCSRNSRIYCHSSRRAPGSRPVDASSMRMTLGRCSNPLAISTRRFRPPERISTRSLRRSLRPRRPSTFSTRSRSDAPDIPCRWPCPRRFSSTVSFLSRLCDWKTTPMRRRTADGSRPTSWPQSVAVPLVGAINVERMRKSVDLPPPLG